MRLWLQHIRQKGEKRFERVRGGSYGQGVGESWVGIRTKRRRVINRVAVITLKKYPEYMGTTAEGGEKSDEGWEGYNFCIILLLPLAANS